MKRKGAEYRNSRKYDIYILRALVQILICCISWHVVIIEACKVERAPIHLQMGRGGVM